ncbi:TonB-dependent siderophore receptor [Halomonas sp. DP8Y7-1]|uniref:TonB-dependent siderophore receptor n=1 Tax=Halomonas sp. DP8Y7-1 TaxID=2859078 RepID=UPI001C97B548|nr:TonB-dependent siderophore receptor [Halomonas sp. DP8Y7-1]MBY6029521.1 TonB-dependent siderophore receptor [Halomonas sp. DP8Y7-1]
MAHHARSNAALHLSRPRLHPLTVAIGLTAGTLLPISSATFAQDTEQLSSITVVGEDLRPTTELSDTYRVESSASASGLTLTPRQTPQSMSFLTRQQMDDEAITSTTEAVERLPGVSAIRLDGTRTNFQSRGYSIRNFQFDGLQSNTSPFWPFGDAEWDAAIYDRVEVVRGATGLMTGVGDPSATVNFVRKKPLDEAAGSVSAAVGRWDRGRGVVDVSTPLDSEGRVGVRFVAAKDRSDSFMDDVEHDRETLYGVLTAELTDRTELTLGVEYQHYDQDGAYIGVPQYYLDGGRTDYDRSTANNTEWANFFTENTRGFVDLTHHFDSGWKARAAYSYGDANYGLTYNYRGGYPDRETGVLYYTPSYATESYLLDYRGDRTQKNLHLSAEGPFELFGREHQLGFGYMDLNEDYEIRSRGPAGDVPALGSFSDRNDPALAEPAWGEWGLTDDTVTEQTGYYAVSRFSLADPVHFIVGARMTDWKIDQDYRGEREYEYDNELTPYAGLIVDITDDLSAYASYTEIFNTQSERSPSGALLDPLEGINYELGLKAELFDDRADLSFAVFQSQQDNLAVEIPGVFVAGTTDQAYTTTDGAEVEGFEVEIAGEVAAGVNLSASYALVDAEDADGNQLNTSYARQQAKVFASWQLPGRWSDLTVGGGARWQGDTYRDNDTPLGTRKIGQGDVFVADAMARYRINANLSAQLNVTNLFDEEYYSQLGFYSQGIYGQPRSALLSLNYDF